MSTVVRRNAHIISHCPYHVVWCPKYRRKVLVNGIDERLRVLIQECVEKWQQAFVQVEVRPDHVHLLVGCDRPPTFFSVFGFSRNLGERIS